MSRILSLFVSLHWTVIFTALALLAGLHGGENFAAVLAAIGIQFPLHALMVPPALCALLAIAFGLVAVLFLWGLVTGALDRRANSEADDIARLAFGGAVGVLTLLFLGCAMMGGTVGLFRSMALEMGALLVSYLAIGAERRAAFAAARAVNPSGAAARGMALHAAHDSLLIRLASGRSPKGRG